MTFKIRQCVLVNFIIFFSLSLPLYSDKFFFFITHSWKNQVKCSFNIIHWIIVVSISLPLFAHSLLAIEVQIPCHVILFFISSFLLLQKKKNCVDHLYVFFSLQHFFKICTFFLYSLNIPQTFQAIHLIHWNRTFVFFLFLFLFWFFRAVLSCALNQSDCYRSR